MKRTAPIKDRKTVAYVFGGTINQRMEKVRELKESGCYMVLASSCRKKKFLDYIVNEHSGNGEIYCLYKSRPYSRFIR